MSSIEIFYNFIINDFINPGQNLMYMGLGLTIVISGMVFFAFYSDERQINKPSSLILGASLTFLIYYLATTEQRYLDYQKFHISLYNYNEKIDEKDQKIYNFIKKVVYNDMKNENDIYKKSYEYHKLNERNYQKVRYVKRNYYYGTSFSIIDFIDSVEKNTFDYRKIQLKEIFKEIEEDNKILNYEFEYIHEYIRVALQGGPKYDSLEDNLFYIYKKNNTIKKIDI